MSGLGIIPTIAAFKNYKTAEKEYENVLARYNEFQGIADVIFSDWVDKINKYNETKDENYFRHLDLTVPEDNKPEGVDAMVLLRVSNLVGKIFYAQPIIVLSNSSKKDYRIHAIDSDFAIYDSGVQLYRLKADATDLIASEKIENRIEPNTVLKSGATMYYVMPLGITGLQEADMKKLRDYICAVCGKKLITSCPKVNVIGAPGKERELINTSILVEWKLYDSRKGDEDGAYKTGVWSNKPGMIGYRMEGALYDAAVLREQFKTFDITSD